jgi:hypothetical protein
MRRPKECDCNRAISNFRSVKFAINGSRIELECTICHGMICWWPISTEQTASLAAHGIKKSSAIPLIDDK